MWNYVKFEENISEKSKELLRTVLATIQLKYKINEIVPDSIECLLELSDAYDNRLTCYFSVNDKSELLFNNGSKDIVVTQENANNIDILFDEDSDEDESFLEDWETSKAGKFYRNVFVFKDFNDTLYNVIKTKDDADSVRDEIVFRFLTLKDDEIDLWLNNKHGVPIHNNEFHFYRKRSPKGSNVNKINRFLACKGDQIKRTGISDNDIILLSYFGSDLHEKKKYMDYVNTLAGYLKIANEKEFEKVERIDKFEYDFNIVYKAYLRNTGAIDYIPVLDNNQSIILEERLLLKPPCVVYGSAGTGKTLLSEELYVRLKEQNPEYDILYLTYMSRLKNQVRADLKKRNFENSNAVFDISDLIKKNLRTVKEHKRKILGFNEFQIWVHENRTVNQFNIKQLDEDEENAISIAYIFFRTYSFDGSLDNKEIFFRKISNEKSLNDRQKEVIYNICAKYQNYISVSKLLVENNAAIKLGECQLKKYDAIIVDEIQDLTEIQVKNLFSLLKDGSSRFYAFGDDNQSINPTLMRMSTANSLVYSYFGNVTNEPIVLKDSYRSTDYLIKYINYINRIRSKTIGKDKDYNDKSQKALRLTNGNESDKPTYVLDKDIIEKAFSDHDLFLNNNIMIIVPNRKEREILLSSHPELEDDDRTYLMTIEETKGGEWDNIILYNFFSSSSDIWGKFAALYNTNNAEKLKSTIHRMFFNRYYVGLTRASKKVIIAESKLTNSDTKEIINVFLPKAIRENNYTFPALTQTDNYLQFRSYFKNDFTHDVWASKAKEKYEIEDYEMAYDFINKAIIAAKSIGVQTAEYEKKKDTYFLRLQLSRKDHMSESDYPYYLEMAIEANNDDFIKEVYEKAGKSERIKILDIDFYKHPDLFIEEYSKNKPTFIQSENDFFSLKAISAYHNIIKKQMKGHEYEQQ